MDRFSLVMNTGFSVPENHGVGGGGGGRGGGEVGENTGCLKGDSDREKRPIVSAKETCDRSSESVTEDSDALTQTYALG